MHGPITIPTAADRATRYAELLPQMHAVLDGETDLIAAMANMTALLQHAFGWHWVGFYRVLGTELVLGPFQGPVACTRIGYGKGVCGTAWEQGRTLVVEDVDAFPGHIACSALSRSEIVVPVQDKEGRVALVLDIDSTALADFDALDERALEQFCALLTPLC